MMFDRTYLMDSDVFITAKNYQLHRRPSEPSHRDEVLKICNRIGRDVAQKALGARSY